MRVMGMFRRFSISLFMHGRSRQKKPRHKTTTDFFSTMNAEHHRYAIPRLLPAIQTSIPVRELAVGGHSSEAFRVEL